MGENRPTRDESYCEVGGKENGKAVKKGDRGWGMRDPVRRVEAGEGAPGSRDVVHVFT